MNLVASALPARIRSGSFLVRTALIGLLLSPSVGLTTTAQVRSERTIVRNPTSGHSYERVAANVNWFQADAAARTSTFEGAQGHLATIAAPDENDFIMVNLGG